MGVVQERENCKGCLWTPNRHHLLLLHRRHLLYKCGVHVT